MRMVIVISSRDPDTRELYVAGLQSSRLEVHATSDVVEIITLAHTVRPDALVVDVLDEGDWESCRRLRADPRTAGIPVVALTGWVSIDGRYRARAARCGYAAFIAKPAVPETVSDTLERVIRGERHIEVMSNRF